MSLDYLEVFKGLVQTLIIVVSASKIYSYSMGASLGEQCVLVDKYIYPVSLRMQNQSNFSGMNVFVFETIEHIVIVAQGI